MVLAGTSELLSEDDKKKNKKSGNTPVNIWTEHLMNVMDENLDEKTIKSKTLCLCSRGWMEETFGTVTSKKVKVKLVETVLTGGKRCYFKMQLT